MNIHDIYNHLFEGKTLQLEFATKEDAESFRVRLANYKSAKDKQMVDVGLIEEAERQRFKFVVEQQQSELPLDTLIEDEPAFLATLKFEEKKILRQYKVVKVIDEPASES